MKKFLLILCFGIFVLSISPAHAVNYDDWIDSIITAGDALITAQNTDGSFDWVNDGNPGNSGSNNVQGATARGLVAAYEQTGLTRFLDAANANAEWIIANLASGSSLSQ